MVDGISGWNQHEDSMARARAAAQSSWTKQKTRNGRSTATIANAMVMISGLGHRWGILNLEFCVGTAYARIATG
jgi:hypothetical protein